MRFRQFLSLKQKTKSLTPLTFIFITAESKKELLRNKIRAGNSPQKLIETTCSNNLQTEIDERMACDFCLRKFNPSVLIKHLECCIKKDKRMIRR